MIFQRETAQALPLILDLARANRALQEVNARLAQQTNYAALLSTLLQEHVGLMEAVDAAAFCYEPENACIRAIAIVQGGVAVSNDPDHPYADSLHPCPISDLPLWNTIKPGVVHASHFDRSLDGSVPSNVEAWHLQRRHTWCLRSALAIGDRCFSTREVPPQKSEVL